MTKILFVSHRADRSGAPRCLLDLAVNLNRQELQPEVVLGEEGPICTDLSAASVPWSILQKQQSRGLGGLFEALRYLQSSQAALVHVNRAVGLAKTFALAARLRRLPVVWHLHDEFHHRRLRRRLPWVRLLATIAVSCSQEILRQEDLPNAQVIANGTRFRTASRADLLQRAQQAGLDECDFRFLFVGTIIPRKNVHLIVEAAALVLEQHPRTEFVLVGGGDEPAYREQIAARLQQPELGGRVRMLEEQEDVAPFYAASDVLLLPSKSEAMPLVVLEAAAHRVPTIASEVGDLPHLIRPEESGWLLPSEQLDAAKLAQKLVAVRALGRAGVEPLGQQARLLLEASHGLRRYISDFEALYQRLLGTSSRRSRGAALP